MPARVRKPLHESVFVLGYAALYLGYLCIRPEGELSHWLTLVVGPFLGLWWIRSRRRPEAVASLSQRPRPPFRYNGGTQPP